MVGLGGDLYLPDQHTNVAPEVLIRHMSSVRLVGI
jgi:hypothetical protein